MWCMFNLLEMGCMSPRHASVLGPADKEDIFQICEEKQNWRASPEKCPLNSLLFLNATIQL